MKKLKEIFHRVAQAIPGVRKAESLEEAQESIVKDSSYLHTMKKWGANIGIAALSIAALGIFAKSGLVLIPALAVGAVYGLVQTGIALIKRDIRAHRETEAEFIAAAGAGPEPSLEPAIKPDAELSSAFKATAVPANQKAANENAVRIKALEQSLADLEVQAEVKRKARELGIAR